MSRGAVVADVIKGQARALKMPGLLRTYEALARQAREERWTHEDYLHEVLSVEIQSRAESAVRQRVLRTAIAERREAARVCSASSTRWIARPMRRESKEAARSTPCSVSRLEVEART